MDAFNLEVYAKSGTILLALNKQFDNVGCKSAADDPEVWIKEIEDNHNQVDEFGLTLQDKDFMLHVMGNLPREFDTVLADLENRLMAECIEKLIIDLLH